MSAETDGQDVAGEDKSKDILRFIDEWVKAGVLAVVAGAFGLFGAFSKDAEWGRSGGILLISLGGFFIVWATVYGYRLKSTRGRANFVLIFSLIPVVIGCIMINNSPITEAVTGTIADRETTTTKIGYLGASIDDLDARDRQRLHVSGWTGVIVRAITPGGPAAATLLRDDVVRRFNNKEVSNPADLLRLAENAPNKLVNFEIWRYDTFQIVPVHLGESSR